MVFFVKILIIVAFFAPLSALAQFEPTQSIQIKFTVHNSNDPDIELVNGMPDTDGNQFESFTETAEFSLRAGNTIRFTLVKPLTVQGEKNARPFSYLLKYLDVKTSTGEYEGLRALVEEKGWLIYSFPTAGEISVQKVLEVQKPRTSVMPVLKSGHIPSLCAFSGTVILPYFHINSLMNNDVNKGHITGAFWRVREYDRNQDLLKFKWNLTTFIEVERFAPFNDNQVRRHKIKDDETYALILGLQKLKKVKENMGTNNVVSIFSRNCPEILDEIDSSFQN